MHARAWSAHAFWHLGRDEEALHWCDWAIARAEEIGHPYSLAVALSYAAMTHQFRRDVPQTLEFARRVQEICARYDFAYYGNWGADPGRLVHGRPGRRRADPGRRWASSATRGPWPAIRTTCRCWPRPCMSAGQPDAAGAVLESARAAAAVHDDRWWLPELYRLDGLRTPGPAGVDLLRRAVAIAEQQGSEALLRPGHRRTRAGVLRPERTPNGPRTPRFLRSLESRADHGRPSRGATMTTTAQPALFDSLSSACAGR